MRREEFRMSDVEARTMLAAAPVIRLAGSLADGTPVLRTLNAVVAEDGLCFHGAPKGEKTSLVGRPVVAQIDEVVADVPSWWTDPVRACPATTLYRSVQVHGVLEAVEAPAAKARVLAALMAKYQPEGGYAPLDAEDPRYRAAIAGLLVCRLPLVRIDGKAKLGQNRKPAELARIVEGLWRRGAPGDPRAIELVRAACPQTPLPAVLEGPAGARLVVAMDPARHLSGTVALLRDMYWNDTYDDHALARAQAAATAWVGAVDADERVIASAHAISDEAKHAWVYDVVVAPGWRGRGLGKALMRMLLDHPRLRGARRVFLATKDATGFYAELGFVPRAALPPKAYVSTEMVLVRDGLALHGRDGGVERGGLAEHDQHALGH